MKSSKKQLHYSQIVHRRKEDKLMPDYIDGKLTEPNENPVIFRYTYHRGEELDISLFVPGAFTSDYILKVVKDSLLWALGILGGASAGMSAYWLSMTEGDWSVLVESWTTVLYDYGPVALAKEVISFLGLGSLGLFVALGYLVYVFSNYDQDVLTPYQNWYNKAFEAKNKVDTEGWYDEEGEWHWRYNGFTIEMQWRYKMISDTVTVHEYQYDKKGKYIETYAANPPFYYGSQEDLEWFEVIKQPEVSYF